MRSCNLGNFFVDAIVKQQKQQPSSTQWATITLGIWNMGGIRSGSIDKSLQGKKNSWFDLQRHSNSVYKSFLLTTLNTVSYIDFSTHSITKDIVDNN